MQFDFPDSLIFDMDGTLWDAVETYTLAWNLYFDRHPIDKRLKKIDLDVLMGLEESKFLEKVLPDFSPNERSIGYEEVVKPGFTMKWQARQKGDVNTSVVGAVDQNRGAVFCVLKILRAQSFQDRDVLDFL